MNINSIIIIILKCSHQNFTDHNFVNYVLKYTVFIYYNDIHDNQLLKLY